MTPKHSIVRGVGGYLPARVLTNDELAKMVDTSDEWIVQRTGIRQRHIAAEGEITSDLAVRPPGARRSRLPASGIDDIDLIIVATTTPDMTFPATATLVQQKLGMHHGAAFDIQAVCSGFVYAVATADSYLKNGLGKRALVIGAETFSRILDWTDRTTCVLFGDGAGAVVLELGRSRTASRGRARSSACARTGTTGTSSTSMAALPRPRRIGHVRMEGNEVFKHAVGMITDVVENVLEDTGLYRRRPRLVRAAPGQSAHHRRRRREARHPARKGGDHRRPARQHLGCLGAAGAEHRRRRWPHQARRPGHDRGHGRRLHLGRLADSLVAHRIDC